MTVAVVQFGGSNCDRDAAAALSHLGANAELIWHDDGLAAGAGVDTPAALDGIVLPGGFSYGDYLRAGAIAARAPILAEVQTAIDAGVPTLGVCNGAQVGAESGLIPGAFTTNASARFQCEHVHLRVERADTPWTSAYDAGAVIEVPIAHAEGRFVADDATAEQLDADGRVLFRYCEPDGAVTDAANPNGSRDNVAGVLGETDNIAVMMPHPERASLPDIGGTDGQGVLRAFA